VYIERYRLDGKTAFITGGGRGIGLCAAQALAEAGARVIISDHDPAVLEAGRAAMAELGHPVEAIELDVTRPADVKQAADDCNAKHGGVDILVANAGIAWPDTGGEDMADEVWLKVVDVNLHGVFWSCRDFGRHMLLRGHGAVVTVGSMSGLISNRPQRQAHYNAAKAGVHHLTRSLAGEWAARGVRVNAVAPGYIDTAMSGAGLRDEVGKLWLNDTPMQRAGRPDEVASVILFLASDVSSLLTGSVIVADAGFTIW
jgi:NAD(P)-dependent dehydrogenase (short-subunit alcohol dehydrogenase family)